MITRFAPSPTGPLHLGHAYSAILAHDIAKSCGGSFLLRIEDIDQSRARPAWEAQIYDDLTWLGLSWPEPVMRQSDRLDVYAKALDRLWARGLLYPCTCSRRDIHNAISAPQEGVPLHGPDGLVYPGTCRPKTQMPVGPRPRRHTLRLDMTAATAGSAALAYAETHMKDGVQSIAIDTKNTPKTIGDIVIARADMATSYHLSVVLDDAAQAVTDVVRGEDLADATQIHVILQTLLGLPTPVYHHHQLIRDEEGKRLAKRDDARALAKYRSEGATPQDIRRMLGL